jgi:hypothetical protein
LGHSDTTNSRILDDLGLLDRLGFLGFLGLLGYWLQLRNAVYGLRLRQRFRDFVFTGILRFILVVVFRVENRQIRRCGIDDLFYAALRLIFYVREVELHTQAFPV